eukprot:CAMPEP_0171651050 /NCGR_PEP_ID=MMETSP0990-20121206/38060_1 /TAXON_ID=483369 /ORGANISM="non described non described, Strain CCMP2098" /LENGTH=360 /DNA_ID=CAMNT_0012229869 /DNA_START=26 /DNA_END=1109 /DNA_ORIENTATION=-
MIDIDSQFECSTHSDDAVYTTERCEHYDSNMCQGSNTDWDEEFPVPCKELAWCREFCGDACKGGTGGLCLLRLMSDLGRTCEAVSQKVVELHGDPSLDDQAHSDVLLHRSDPFVDHGDAIDNGCGYHALCSECSGDCAVEAVQDYFFGLFGQTLEGLTPTVAPAPHAKFALFAQPLETCDHFGLLSAEALAFKHQAPSQWADPGQWLRTVAVLVAVPSLVVAVLSCALLVRWKDKPWLELVRRVREDGRSGGGKGERPQKHHTVYYGGVVALAEWRYRRVDLQQGKEANGAADWYTPAPQVTSTASAQQSPAAAAVDPKLEEEEEEEGSSGGHPHLAATLNEDQEEDLLHLLGSSEHAVL